MQHLFQPKQNAQTAAKCFSCFSLSPSVSAVYRLALRQWIQIVIG